MKKSAFLLLLLFQSFPSLAQLSAEQRIQDSVIGWWSNLRFDKLKPAVDASGKKKTETLNKFVEWMKKSYTPVAGLGTYSRYIGKNGYGVDFLVWNVSYVKPWLDEKGHFKPISEENTRFTVATNLVFGAFPIYFIEKSGKTMFTMQPDGYAQGDGMRRKRKGADPKIHPNAAPYITWINEWNTVYLAPNNKLPIVAVTKGELLQAAEDALQSVANEERKQINSQWPNNPKAQQEAFESRNKTIESYRSKIQQLREKHRSSLNEPAIVRTMQVSMYSFETDPDLFVISPRDQDLKQFYPVYKVDPAVANHLSDEKPAWVAVAFPFQTKEDGNQLLELYTAMSQNFNYEYVYNYFFAPEKVSGKPYVPANEASLKARLDQYRERGKAALHPVSTNTASGNVYFKEDFAAGTTGSDPVNWFFRKQSRHAVLTEIPGQTGKWLQLGYFNPVWPTLLNYPLPQNFSLEFDLVTDGNFTGQTGGGAMLTLNSRKTLANGHESTGGPGSTVTINIVSGNETNGTTHNYRGVLDIDANSSPSLNTQNFAEGAVSDIPLTEFTNRKTKIHVAVNVKNGNVAVFVNGQEKSNSANWKLKYGAPCVTCGLRPETLINSITWKSTTNDSETVNVYLGNVTIEKL